VEKVQAQLLECESALVSPYELSIELRDTVGQMKADPPQLKNVLVVADDRNGYLVFYDPIIRIFGLAEYATGRDRGRASSINVNGDFIGTFFAR